MLCGVVTQEKERDSLVLLLLTNLRPWQIVAQKYLGGLIPALSFLLLAMPLAAVAYSYGGMTTRELTLALLMVTLGVFQLGALALWCSCWFRKTVQAFLAAYILGGLFYAGPGLLVALGHELNYASFDEEAFWWATVHVPAVEMTGLDNQVSLTPGLSQVWLRCGAIVLSTLVFLLAAARHLPRRAFVPTTQWLRRFFAAWDRLAHRVNAWVGGVTLGRRRADLPGAQPIVWRERRARALARPEYLVRLSLALNVVVIGIAFACLEVESGDQEGLSALLAVLGCGAVALLATNAAESMAGERANQTLDLLLSTPLSAAQLVREKARALRPLALMVAVPMAIVLGIEAFMETLFGYQSFWTSQLHQDAPLVGLVSGLLAIVVYLPLVTWVGLWMGMWCRSRLRALITSWIVLLTWCIAPIVVLVLLEVRLYRNDAPLLYLLTPVFVPIMSEEGDLYRYLRNEPWLCVLLNYAFYAGAALLMRLHCLVRADAYLRR
jgi:ABC-type transport system involved in multi-copper enzyme maturation permease subunit